MLIWCIYFGFKHTVTIMQLCRVKLWILGCEYTVVVNTRLWNLNLNVPCNKCNGKITIQSYNIGGSSDECKCSHVLYTNYIATCCLHGSINKCLNNMWEKEKRGNSILNSEHHYTTNRNQNTPLHPTKIIMHQFKTGKQPGSWPFRVGSVWDRVRPLWCGQGS